MKEVNGNLIIGVVLVFLGISGIVEPLDNKVTSIVGPYLMMPIGLVLLIFRGILPILSIKDIKPYYKYAWLISTLAMTLGVLLILFSRSLIDTLWIRIVVGLGVFGLGLLLRLSMNRVDKQSP